MNDVFKSIASTVALVTGILITAPLAAENVFLGVWQPNSDPVAALGAMAVEAERLSFGAGPVARLEPVREN